MPNLYVKTASGFPVVGKMTEDSAGNVWICTEGGGLNCYHGDTGVFSRYMYQKGDQSTLGSNNVKSVFIERRTIDCMRGLI